LPVGRQPTPQNGSTEVAQSGSISAREHRCHEMSVTRERHVPHRGHAYVHTVEPLPPHPPIDRVRPQAQRQELSLANYSVLPPRQISDRPIEGSLPDRPCITRLRRQAPRIHPSMPVVRPGGRRRRAPPWAGAVACGHA
jgi:hypothetical protein